MKNKKGVVLSLLMSLLVSGSSAMENSGKGNNSKGGSNVTLDNRKNIETDKTVAGYTITAILALFLGYKIGHRNEDVNTKEIQEGKQLNKCSFMGCSRGGKEFELNDDIYICSNCFKVACENCSCSTCLCNVKSFRKIEYFFMKAQYLPNFRNAVKLAKYRFLMKAQEEQKNQKEELAKKANNLDKIKNI